MDILLVEDDLDLGDGLRLALEDEGHRPVWVRRRAEAQQQIEQADPDLALLDLGLPDGDGHALLAALRRDGRRTPVLIISARDALEERLRGLDGGADDFLLKPFALRELLSRVRALARRSYGLDAGLMQLRGLQLQPAAHRASIEGRPLDLTPTEFRLLLALMKRPDRVLTRAYLLQQVMGADCASTNLLDVHISGLRRKVGEGYLRTVRGVGYAIDRESSA